MKEVVRSPGWRILPLALLLSVRMAGAQGSPQNPKPELTLGFENAAVVAGGLTPGGKIAWFSVAREATGAGSLIARREQVTADDDGDGSARLDLDRPVPPRSMWAAVDLKTGEVALATPGDYPLRRMALAAGTFHPGAAGDFDRVLAEGHDSLELFVARPAVGAWALSVWDGARDDEDGPANRRLSLAFDGMAAVGQSPAPPVRLLPGDVVVLMDPDTMQVAAVKLAGGRP